MTELYEKSLRKLELDNVLAQLADCANSEARARRASMSSSPWQPASSALTAAAA